MKKITKRQKAILSLLNIVETEGLHYGLVNYGGSDEVKAIKDEKLSKLFETFRKTSDALEAKLAELQKEVSAFVEDEEEF